MLCLTLLLSTIACLYKLMLLDVCCSTVDSCLATKNVQFQFTVYFNVFSCLEEIFMDRGEIGKVYPIEALLLTL